MNGQLIAAVEEERFNRKKHCAGFPTAAILYCLEAANISPDKLDHVGISRDPSAHLQQKILFSIARLPNLSGLISKRLANAAKVFDLRQELARALSDTDAQAADEAMRLHVRHGVEATVQAVCGVQPALEPKWRLGRVNSK